MDLRRRDRSNGISGGVNANTMRKTAVYSENKWCGISGGCKTYAGNKGSAVIEMTFLIPILMGCIYFYIMSMFFLIEHGKCADELSGILYETYDQSVNDSAVVLEKQGNTISAGCNKEYENYIITIEFKSDASDIVKDLRRWQLIADTVR